MTAPNLLVVGSGRIATHIKHILRLHDVSFAQWQRSIHSMTDLPLLSRRADIALLAVSDDAIEDVGQAVESKIKVHFSGSFCHPEIIGIHPLMSFGKKLYSKEEYSRIPLISDRRRTDWPPQLQLLNAAPNPIFEIEPHQKALYHSLCHLAGNYPRLIWSEVMKTFSEKLDLPPEILKPFLKQVLENAFGPEVDMQIGVFARQDMKAIANHLQALTTKPHLKKSYESFRTLHQESDL